MPVGIGAMSVAASGVELWVAKPEGACSTQRKDGVISAFGESQPRRGRWRGTYYVWFSRAYCCSRGNGGRRRCRRWQQS